MALVPLPWFLVPGIPLFKRWRLRRNGVEIQGTCVDLRHTEGSYFVRYKYLDAEGITRHRTTEGSLRPYGRPGDSLAVVYDAKKPRRSMLVEESRRRGWAVAVLIIVLIVEIPCLALFIACATYYEW
ncbi:DUF3592 domain-containing protein [Streptomyces adelaidensis]|uniref:DUF3592 domain-containing protein n=1 Tax=Streptomyces adelaidensis TaxID=2796465 RepID=UPI001902D46B|nr:DUF3592 domain-containing protein [Streptomyces adelaidensis]